MLHQRHGHLVGFTHELFVFRVLQAGMASQGYGKVKTLGQKAGNRQVGRTTAGPAYMSKAAYAEISGKLLDIFDIAGQFPFGLIAATPESGPVAGDKPETLLLGRLMKYRALQAAGGGAVGVDNRVSSGGRRTLESTASGHPAGSEIEGCLEA
jgi:hypothetical protein